MDCQTPLSVTIDTTGVEEMEKETRQSTQGRLSTTSSVQEYLECKILPALLPSLKSTLEEAIKKKCFERKHANFHPLECLARHLCKNNPQRQDTKIPFEDIGWVKNARETRPCYPTPKHLLWDEFEATLIIQSLWRGHMVRNEEEVKELRRWQKEWRLLNEQKRSQDADKGEESPAPPTEEREEERTAVPAELAHLPRLRLISNVSVEELCHPATVSNVGL